MPLPQGLRGLRMPAGALLLALLLGPFRLAAGQGLQVGDDTLAASEAATASQFAAFEDALILAALTTGGRGKGGKGGTTGRSVFSDADKLAELQQGMYTIAAAPDDFPTCRHRDGDSWNPADTSQRPDCNNFVPNPRDQRDCATCVTAAVAEAMQIAVATALQEPVAKWEVNPASLYYCSNGGRSCQTGWDIQEALHTVIDEQPRLMRPSSCVADVAELNNVNLEASTFSWGDICDRGRADAGSCSAANVTGYFLSCSYKSLGTFWQIQRHIRNHGAVITRVRIPDDWEAQFGLRARDLPGEVAAPYHFNASARGLYGHAAVIVGYNNTERTWLLLNSWGNATTRPGRKGVTADGLLRVEMGLLAVGTPDQTYGVECVPAPGSPGDLHDTQPWEQLSAKTVEAEHDGEDTNLDAECHIYRFNKSTDTVASVVDHFGLNMTAFLKENTAATASRSAAPGTGDLFALEDVSYSFVGTMSKLELQQVLDTSNSVLRLDGGMAPTVRCSHFDAGGVETVLECTTNATDCMRLGNGTVGCTLYYSAFNASSGSLDGRRLRICGASRPDQPGAFDRVARFADMDTTQTRALLAMVRALGNPPTGANITKENICQDFAIDGTATSWLRVQCSRDGMVILIILNEPEYYRTLLLREEALVFGDALARPLLQFPALRNLYIAAFDGPLPVQFGALKELKTLDVRFYCPWGDLPARWFASWPKLYNVSAMPVISTRTISTLGGRECGLTGTWPSTWERPGMLSHLREMHITSGLLSGTLPSFADANMLEEFDLSFNLFTGDMPRTWANLTALKTVNLTGDAGVVGSLPRSWRSSELQFILNGTGMSGCIPAELLADDASRPADRRTTYGGSRITGMCLPDAMGTEQLQVDALVELLPLLLDQAGGGDQAAMLTTFFDDLKRRGSLLDQVGTRPVKELYAYPMIDRQHILTVVANKVASEGIAYITDINLYRARLDLRHLPALAQRLPKLRAFTCRHCTAPAGPQSGSRAALELPASLAASAPSMQRFALVNSSARGPLPPEWGSWVTLEELDLSGNSGLTGELPGALRGMHALRALNLSGGGLSGSLPSSWGSEVDGMADNATINLSGNVLLGGEVPSSYARFGLIDVSNTTVSGCSPGITVLVGSGVRMPQCETTEQSAVRELYDKLKRQFGANPVLDSWLTPEGDVLAHCRNKTGIACSKRGTVIGIDLSSLGLKPPRGRRGAPSSLSDIVAPLLKLPGLKALSLARLGLKGRLQASISGAAFPNLQELDISGNPGIVGVLPSSWGALVGLTHLDVSGCGLRGPLPESWTALQQLRVLRVAGNRGIGGQLPPVFGLLSSLQELDASDAGLSGPALPPAWVDPLQLRAAVDASSSEQVRALAAGVPAAAGGGEQLAAPTAASGADQGVMLRNLEVLRLGGNGFEGDLPPELSQLRALRVVDLSAADNASKKLKGSLPAAWMYLQKLQELSLAGQDASGQLPQQWSTMASMQRMNLANNRLTGGLPPGWVGMSQMQLLDLSGNRLSGAVPGVWTQRAGWCDKVALRPGNQALSTGSCGRGKG